MCCVTLKDTIKREITKKRPWKEEDDEERRKQSPRRLRKERILDELRRPGLPGLQEMTKKNLIDYCHPVGNLSLLCRWMSL